MGNTPIYTYAENFYQGSAIVHINNEAGLIDPAGKLLIPVQYEDLQRLGIYMDAGDTTPFKRDSGYSALRFTFRDTQGRGVIDGRENIILPAEYYSIHTFHNGYARIIKGSLSGFADLRGNVILPPIYLSVEAFHNGYAVVSNHGQQGLINTSGSFIIPLKEGQSISSRRNKKDEFIICRSKKGKNEEGKVIHLTRCGLANLTGNIILPVIYQYVRMMSDSSGLWLTTDTLGQMRLVNGNGAQAVNLVFNSLAILDFNSYNKAIFRSGEYFGLLDKNGKVHFKEKLDRLSYVTYGSTLLMERNGKHGIVTHNGEVLAKLEYDYIAQDGSYFYLIKDSILEIRDIEHYNRLELNNAMGHYRQSSLKVFPFNTYSEHKEYQQGLVDASGNVIFWPSYDIIQSESGYIVTTDTMGNTAAYDPAGTLLIPPGRFSFIGHFGPEEMPVFVRGKRGLYGLIDHEGNIVTDTIYCGLGLTETPGQCWVQECTNEFDESLLQAIDLDKLNITYDYMGTKESTDTLLQTLRKKIGYAGYGGDWGLMSTAGEWILDTEFTAPFFLNDRNIIFSTKRGWQVIRQDGASLFPVGFSAIADAGLNCFWVQNDTGAWALANGGTGELLTKHEFITVSPFFYRESQNEYPPDNGWAIVKLTEGRETIIDIQGKFLVRPTTQPLYTTRKNLSDYIQLPEVTYEEDEYDAYSEPYRDNPTDNVVTLRHIYGTYDLVADKKGRYISSPVNNYMIYTAANSYFIDAANDIPYQIDVSYVYHISVNDDVPLQYGYYYVEDVYGSGYESDLRIWLAKKNFLSLSESVIVYERYGSFTMTHLNYVINKGSITQVTLGSLFKPGYRGEVNSLLLAGAEAFAEEVS
ncbi:MAG: WG repeat-containing protein, partial [Bacteroidota bacterium]|nr:WG repeat-containing protein [Bacteroidota bacterium]